MFLKTSRPGPVPGRTPVSTRNALLTAAILALLFPGFLPATVIHVPGEQPTIQAGIDAAVNGDTVLVADGLYTGTGNRDLGFGGKAIIVQSENGPSDCVIDCQSAGRGFLFQSGEGPDSVVRGVTVRNGTGTFGGGFYCAASSPTIDDNVISGNSAVNGGAGIYCNDASPVITGNVITQNTVTGNNNGGGISMTFGSSPLVAGNTITLNSAPRYGGGLFWAGAGTCPVITGNLVSGNSAGYGGGIYCWNDATITDCRLLSNDADYGGGLYCNYSSPTVANCLLAGNTANVRGGGAYCDESAAEMSHCTFADNTAVVGGGGVAYEESSAVILRSILWGNDPEQVAVVSGDPPSVTWTDIEGLWYGTGNMDSDPLFVTGPGGDCYLGQTAAGQLVDSPCVDGGNVPAADVCFTATAGIVCLHRRTTRTDLVTDQGLADLGYHHDPGELLTVQADLTCLPASGTVPFSTSMTVTLGNLFAGQVRRLAGRIDVELGGGTSYISWKAGYANVAPESSVVFAWNQNIPALSPVIGSNEFTLRAEDITPSPYNQPPYPAAGALDTAGCTVVGLAP